MTTPPHAIAEERRALEMFERPNVKVDGGCLWLHIPYGYEAFTEHILPEIRRALTAQDTVAALLERVPEYHRWDLWRDKDGTYVFRHKPRKSKQYAKFNVGTGSTPAEAISKALEKVME